MDLPAWQATICEISPSSSSIGVAKYFAMGKEVVAISYDIGLPLY